MIISSPPPFHTAPSPSPKEFEDLSTFLRCRHRKKLEEKRERMQPRITNFFHKIKKEPDYDRDDEHTSPAATSHTPISSPKGRKCPTTKGNMGKRSPKTVQSPGLLNKLAVHIPPGTFMAISVTFASIAASQQDVSKVSKNLIGSFDEVSTKSETPVSPLQIVIQPTESTSEAVRISPSSLTGADDYDLVMVNCETQTQTNIIEMQSCALQTKSCKVRSTPSQTEGKELFNRETNMSPSMTETIETQTDLKFSTSQMQTELDVRTAETQAEITVQSSEVQTEVEVITSETQTEVELPAAQTQTEWDVNTLETQTESTVQTTDMQTELPDDKIVQTEVNNSNILTVNRIEVVSEMLSWGMQTDLEELASMTPIYLSNLDDDTDSILSSASKHDNVTLKSAIKPAGLDMHIGEYRDVEFPPVSTINVPMKPLMEHAI